MAEAAGGVACGAPAGTAEGPLPGWACPGQDLEWSREWATSWAEPVPTTLLATEVEIFVSVGSEPRDADGLVPAEGAFVPAGAVWPMSDQSLPLSGSRSAGFT